MARKKREEAAELMGRMAREGVARVSPMTSWEKSFEEEARARGQAEMDRRLAELPPEQGKPKSCPRCGKRTRVRGRAVGRTFQSLWGIHKIVRDYYYCDGCKEGFYPRDEFLGLPKAGDLTEEVESRIADFSVNDSYQEAQDRWRFHYRLLPVSDNQFRQVAKRLGDQIEECQDIVLESAVRPPPKEPSKRLYVMNDGGMVPMQRGEWREVKVGVIFREENYSSGEGVRGVVSEARFEAVLGEPDEFKKRMRAGLDAESARSANETVWIADGAPQNWNMAGLLCPAATQVLDWCHALEHAVNCGKAILGETDPLLADWKIAAEQLLWSGDTKTLLRELEACRPDLATEAQKRALENLISYYQTNQHRMAYGEFRDRGLLIGSGIVESAHRHVIQTRMKKAGQHWSERGGRQMARLRAAYRTAGSKTFYAAIRWAYRTSRRATALLPKPYKVDLRRAIFRR
jgi:hypothetical protein